MNTSPNESGQLQKLSLRESKLLTIKAHIIAIKDLHYPILYRYGKKILDYIGVEL